MKKKKGQSSCDYIALIMNWKDTEAHWIQGYDSLVEAQESIKKIYADNRDILNRVVILRGEIEQIGINTNDD